MEPRGTIRKTTKRAELTVHLISGERMRGHFHIPAGTSQTVRPSDAVRETRDGFMLLTDVEVIHNDETSTRDAVLVRIDAVAYMDLPDDWGTVQPGGARRARQGQ